MVHVHNGQLTSTDYPWFLHHLAYFTQQLGIVHLKVVLIPIKIMVHATSMCNYEVKGRKLIGLVST